MEGSDGRWTRVAERGSLLGMRITVWCYRALGRRACEALVHVIVAYFFLTDRAGRRASLAYLRRVHAHPVGRASLGGEPSPWLSFQRYREFGLAIVDRLALWSGRTDDFSFDTSGMEIYDRLAAEGRGALILGAHLGSFDAMRLLADRTKREVNVLMYTQHAQRINRIFRELSPGAEARVIAVDPASIHSVFEIRARLEKGEHVAILADRLEAGDRGRSCRVPLLGGEVELPLAPLRLAALLGCPVTLMVATRSGPGRYRIFAESLADRVPGGRRATDEQLSQLVTAYAARLEHLCVRFPLQWFNFFDYWREVA